jgi:hypothetical protein
MNPGPVRNPARIPGHPDIRKCPDVRKKWIVSDNPENPISESRYRWYTRITQIVPIGNTENLDNYGNTNGLTRSHRVSQEVPGGCFKEFQGDVY